MRKHGKAPKRRDENTQKGGQRWADIHTNPDLSIRDKTPIKEKEKKKRRKLKRLKEIISVIL